MKDKMENLAKNLRYYRKNAGLTQQELGNRIAYSGKAVSKWEAGYVFPPTEALLRLAEVLQVDLDTLFAFKEAPTYFLGVDGGGTKTKFILADENGKLLRQTLQGPCNAVNMGRDAITAVLTRGIAETCQGIPLGQICAFFGIAGAASIQPELLQSILKRFGFSAVSYGSDAENIISAGLQGQDGIIAIMGTGSVVFNSRNGKLTRIGGYGHLLGDHASGYEIGKAGLYAILSEGDGSGRETLLTALFEKETGQKIFDALPEFYQKGKTYIAGFAPMVFKAARAGDAAAREIIEDNIRRFSAKLKAARRHFKPGAEIPLVLGGGLTKAADLLLPLLEKELAGENLKIKVLTEEPVMGAVRLAKLLNGEEK